jgi:NADPH-dependent curcumin reductase CurA
MKTKQIVLASRPLGFPSKENFKTEEKETGDPREGEVLLESLYISVDPYMRGCMNESRSYTSAYQLNEPVVGGNVSKVLSSRSSLFKDGDMVTGDLPWSLHNIASEKNLRKIEPVKSIPPSYYLGILGMPGLTAYFGMIDIGKPKAGRSPRPARL